MITGSCLCGDVRFESDRPPERAHSCYCSRCRKVRGGACSSNLILPFEGFRWTAGETAIRRFQPPDAERFMHAFCARCGSSVPAENAARGVMVVPMGVLDTDPGLAPQAHIFVGSKADWVEIHDELPRFEGHVDSKRIG